MNRENKIIKFTSFVLLITVLAIILVSGTYAKYTSTASGTDATVVANWSFNVNDTNIAKEEFEFNLFDTANIKDSDGETAETDVAAGLIAPGTSGAFEFALENTSDVTAKYDIKLTAVNEKNIPIEYSFDGDSWETDLENLVATDIMAIGSTKNVTVQWRWAFGENETTDVLLGGATVTVTASITATQCNNLDEAIMLNGDGQTYYTLAPSTLSFRSSANIGDFQEVQVNGETIDQSNYTMTEGSTIINLSIDYLKTLAEDDYTISIVSNTGSPNAGFSVVAPDVNNHGFYYNQPYTAYVENFGSKCTLFVHEDGTLDAFVGSDVETSTYTVDGNSFTVSSASLGTLDCTISEDGLEIYNVQLATAFKLGDESMLADKDYIYQYDESLGGYRVKDVIDKSKSSYGAIRTGLCDKPTVSIGTAFRDITSLVIAPEIPDSVTTIEQYAFEGCTNLEQITFPRYVTSIDRYAFENCTSLKNMTIPASVTDIHVFAFNGCTGLQNIYIDEQNGNYCSVDGVMFNKSETTLCKYPAGKDATSYVVPDNVTRIEQNSFQECVNLKQISIPNNVTYIEDHAFSDCKELVSVILPNGIPQISSYLFDGCVNLTSVTIPANVTYIFGASFYDCAKLTNITFEGTMSQWNAINFIGTNWFYNVPATEVICSDGTVTL